VNWDAIGAIGEIVGAAAVVISLVYLAVQIRAQNKEAQVAAMHEIAVGYRDALATFSDEGMADLFEKAYERYDELSLSESIRLISGLQRVFRVWEEAYIQFEEGRLEPRIWDSMVQQYASYLSMPPFQNVWELRGRYFDKAFQEFVNELRSTEHKFK